MGIIFGLGHSVFWDLRQGLGTDSATELAGGETTCPSVALGRLEGTPCLPVRLRTVSLASDLSLRTWPHDHVLGQ